MLVACGETIRRTSTDEFTVAMGCCGERLIAFYYWSVGDSVFWPELITMVELAGS